MKLFRWTMVLGLLACAAPLAAPFLAQAISWFGNCPPGLGGPPVCIIGMSYHLAMMPWLLLFTIYIGAFLFALWILVEAVHIIRRNSTNAGQTGIPE